MRIETYNQIAALYHTSGNTKVKGIAQTGSRDEVQISQAGRDFQIAKKAVEQCSDVRESKVAQLKKMIDAGEYQVSAGDFASKLLEKYKQQV